MHNGVHMLVCLQIHSGSSCLPSSGKAVNIPDAERESTSPEPVSICSNFDSSQKHAPVVNLCCSLNDPGASSLYSRFMYSLESFSPAPVGGRCCQACIRQFTPVHYDIFLSILWVLSPPSENFHKKQTKHYSRKLFGWIQEKGYTEYPIQNT